MLNFVKLTATATATAIGPNDLGDIGVAPDLGQRLGVLQHVLPERGLRDALRGLGFRPPGARNDVAGLLQMTGRLRSEEVRELPGGFLNAAPSLDTLRSLRGNRLEALRGDRSCQYSIRINRQWRLCFEWPDGQAGPTNVEIVDYHG